MTVSPPRPIKTVLVANRGEVAIRVFRAATELGMRTVAIYAHEDRLSIHRYKADEAWQVGQEGAPRAAYLAIDEIIALAKSRNVDAIHPGYGFLSENPDFSQACADAGIVFVGPSGEVLESLGDKIAARHLALAAEVPVIPGTDGAVSDLDAALVAASDIGYPVMLKAAFGGGGRGMRRCDNGTELEAAFASAQREAQSAFGRADVFLEKFVVQPRHIEVQLLGDHQGDIIHLFERDCSIQRRNQKVVEVAPALNLAGDLRERLFADAIKVARQAKLVGAATAEFLVGEDGSHFFIEVNPRLQVEHTITELITGVDIVQAQLHIASGLPLSDEKIGLADQGAVSVRGAAIQARVTTEDPRNNFAPDTGRISVYRSAAGFGIRLDTGIAGAGAEITPHYDSLIVKVSAFGLTHDVAAQKLLRSLKEFRIRGVTTNIPFLERIIAHASFRAGTADTGFVARTPDLYDFPARKNRAGRMLHALAETTVNGPPGLDKRPERPAITVTPRVPPPVTPPSNASPSFKSILDEHGPDAVAKAVTDTKRLLITDTTFRDAHQSLLATRVRTRDMLAVATATEQRLPGVFSVECWGGATFDVAFRFLRENPWARLRQIRAAMPNTLLQMLLRGSNAVGYTNYPQNIVRRFVQLAAEAGVDVFRIFDCFNQLDAMRSAIDEVRAQGKIAEVSICYTSDLHNEDRPLYTLDYYRRKAREFAEAGAHMLAIKDMAGLLKPRAAIALTEALKAETGLPLHVHTHDTSGNGIAMLLAASGAGADVVDAASASMSGLTSQPSLDALAAALSGAPRDVGFSSAHLADLADYWEAVRTWYQPFESGLRASTADVYDHEIPGGQYSNLKPQALAVGLAEEWPQVRARYREVNFALGDLIKVTPSSKVVGDFALWLVKNNLTVEALLASETVYDFPDSLIQFFNGHIGIPEGGFPAMIRERILGAGAPPPPTRPVGLDLPDYDFEESRRALALLTDVPLNDELVVSHALYPKVVSDFVKYREKYADTSVIDTETFFYGLTPGKEVVADIEPGKSLIIEHKAVSALSEDVTREVHFMLNGQPRSVVVVDRHAGVEAVTREKKDPQNDGHVGAPMPGNVLDVTTKVGDAVSPGDALLTLEAMKLETTVRAPHDGTVTRLLVVVGDRIDAQDLLVVVAAPE